MKTLSLLPVLLVYWSALLIMGIHLVRHLIKGDGVRIVLVTAFLLLPVAAGIPFFARQYDTVLVTCPVSYLGSFLIGLGSFIAPVVVWSTRFLRGKNRLFPWSRE